ncbi:TPA: hypothetical protein KDZ97_003642 [Vibrio parahaemolyticus]|uniref:hypothetical protein n=1 Tax=Vibrio parahaemolyticus TaxID=670 RepID=UPI001B825B44|nr:hypothetical protein [Vibrio parahaemolyticus]MDF5646662.1 hypothetical protein [Vibrio parahaemolyticus]MDF5666079.1 hypothetical protein [Vibrio parahaemolyticus]WKV19329.1 hypothetical protein [Vibrio parahaemolyticus]HBC3539108.1 hypothetical protein [Vibrio parahaemolyticus]HBC3815549.1 hypothetical protein [Vibrio parahaemolyticus]
MSIELIVLNADKFVKEINDYIDGSGVKLIFHSDYTFEFKHRTCLFTNDAMIPSKMLQKKVKELFKQFFTGYLPHFNNVGNTFWPELESRFIVNVYDNKRHVHRYKVLSTTSSLDAPLSKEVLALFGYKHSSECKVIRYENCTGGLGILLERSVDSMLYNLEPSMLDALMNDSENFTVEYNPQIDKSFNLVSERDLDAELDEELNAAIS